LPRDFDDVVAELGVALRAVEADNSGALERTKSLRAEIEERDVALRKEFSDVEMMLRDKGMPEEILQRHRDFVAEYEKRLSSVKAGLDNVERGAVAPEGFFERAWFKTKILFTGDPVRQEAAGELEAQLESYRPRKVQKSFKPEDLPFRRLTPENTPKPKETAEEWQKVLAEPSEHTASLQKAIDAVADALISPAQAQATDLPGPEDLAETIEVQFTPEIVALAAQLNNNPVEIYNWVRNNIRFVPVWGSVLGAQVCLEIRKCGATDTASLLIALLRVSGVPARYQFGTISVDQVAYRNWLGGFSKTEDAATFMASLGTPQVVLRSSGGGQPTAVKHEHVWVQAFVDFYPSQGVVNRQPDSWVDIDASFKQYEITNRTTLIDLVEPESIDAIAQVYETAGATGNVDYTALRASIDLLKGNIDTSIADGTFDLVAPDTFGSILIPPVTQDALSARLPFDVNARGVRVSEVPSILRHRLVIALRAGDEAILNWETSLPELGFATLLLSYAAASDKDQQFFDNFAAATGRGSLIPSAVRVVPTLTVGSSTFMARKVLGFGAEMNLQIEIVSPTVRLRAVNNSQYAGESLVVTVNAGSVSNAELARKSIDIANLAELGSTNPGSGVLVDEGLPLLLHRLGLEWFQNVDFFSQILASSQGAITARFPSFGITAIEVHSEFAFGMNRGARASGLGFDVDSDVFAMSPALDADANTAALTFTHGFLASYMESAVPTEFFSGLPSRPQWDSTASILSRASQLGDTIVQVDESNIADVISDLVLPAGVISQIADAVYAGLVVVTPVSPTLDPEFPGYAGVGYVLLDPETGAAAFLVADGDNGSDEKDNDIDWRSIIEGLALKVAGPIISILKTWVECLLDVGGLGNDPAIALRFLAGIGLIALWVVAALAISIFAGPVTIPLLLFSLTLGAKVVSIILGALVALAFAYLLERIVGCNISSQDVPRRATLLTNRLRNLQSHSLRANRGVWQVHPLAYSHV